MKTNSGKFKIVALAVRKTEPIIVEGTMILIPTKVIS